jgi:plastocyanin
MKLRMMMNLMVVLALSMSAGVAAGDGTNDKDLVVTAMFGTGMNTVLPPNTIANPANHHVLPQEIHVRTGGVVNFVVAGYHQIFVYNPGVEAADINVPSSGTFINDMGNLYFQGILPAGGPPATPATTNPSNAQNRVEPVLFTTPGTYLVICNVRGHFLGGMYAYVVVEDHPNQGKGNNSAR